WCEGVLGRKRCRASTRLLARYDPGRGVRASAITRAVSERRPPTSPGYVRGRQPRTARSTLSTPQFIYVMKGLRKVVPPNREVLKGLWLSFYPGAKIGVVGPNGAGKSTLLRIDRKSTRLNSSHVKI